MTSMLGKFMSGVAGALGDLNQATLSGAIDIIVVEHDAEPTTPTTPKPDTPDQPPPQKYYCSTPFHCRFGKLSLLRPSEQTISIAVNGKRTNIFMKLGKAGEAFFVEELPNADDFDSQSLDSDWATSPIHTPRFDSQNATKPVMEPFDLNAETAPSKISDRATQGSTAPPSEVTADSRSVTPAPTTLQPGAGQVDDDDDDKTTNFENPEPLNAALLRRLALEQANDESTTASNSANTAAAAALPPMSPRRRLAVGEAQDQTPDGDELSWWSWEWGSLPLEQHAHGKDIFDSGARRRRKHRRYTGGKSTRSLSKRSPRPSNLRRRSASIGSESMSRSKSDNSVPPHMQLDESNRGWVSSIFRMFGRRKGSDLDATDSERSPLQAGSARPTPQRHTNDHSDDELLDLSALASRIDKQQQERQQQHQQRPRSQSLSGTSQSQPTQPQARPEQEPEQAEEANAGPLDFTIDAAVSKRLHDQHADLPTEISPSPYTAPAPKERFPDLTVEIPSKPSSSPRDAIKRNDSMVSLATSDTIFRTPVEHQIAHPPHADDKYIQIPDDTTQEPTDTPKETDAVEPETFTSARGKDETTSPPTVEPEPNTTQNDPETPPTNPEMSHSMLFEQGAGQQSRSRNDSYATTNSEFSEAESDQVSFVEQMVSQPPALGEVTMSLCGHLLGPNMDSNQAAFVHHQISFKQLCAEPSVVFDRNLIIRSAGKLYPSSVAFPLLMSHLAFGRPLSSRTIQKMAEDEAYSHLHRKGSDEEAAKAGHKSGWFSWFRRSRQHEESEQFPEQESASTASAQPLDGITIEEPKSGTEQGADGELSSLLAIDEPGSAMHSRSTSTPELKPSVPLSAPASRHGTPIRSSRDRPRSLSPPGRSVLSSSPVSSRLLQMRKSSISCGPRYRKSLRPTSSVLASLNLRRGRNVITFSVSSSFQGTQSVSANLFLWSATDKIVVSDVDGTITKSDVLGHFLPNLGVNDWSHDGVVGLFDHVKNNGYQMLYLTSRAIGQASITRSYILSLQQGNSRMPMGPVIMAPDSLVRAFKREVIDRKPQDFKIPALKDVRNLFPEDVNPFYAGFGNRVTDLVSYLAVEIPQKKIFIINPSGEIAHYNKEYKKSYTFMGEYCDAMFPASDAKPQAIVDSFNDLNFWSTKFGNSALPPLDPPDDNITDKHQTETKRFKESSRPNSPAIQPIKASP